MPTGDGRKAPLTTTVPSVYKENKAMAMTAPGSIESNLSHDLRQAVLDMIGERGLSAEELADELDLVPTAVRALLVRERWPLRTALLMADGLRLPLAIHLDRQQESA